jgi:hypothetical protein
MLNVALNALCLQFAAPVFASHALVDDMPNWVDVQPLYLRLSRQSITRDDVDGITAFYRASRGEAELPRPDPTPATHTG